MSLYGGVEVRALDCGLGPGRIGGKYNTSRLRVACLRRLIGRETLISIRKIMFVVTLGYLALHQIKTSSLQRTPFSIMLGFRLIFGHHLDKVKSSSSPIVE